MAIKLVLAFFVFWLSYLPAECQETEQNLYRLALSQTLKEEYSQALQNFNEVIQLNPLNWDAYLYRSLCYLKSKNYFI